MKKERKINYNSQKINLYVGEDITDLSEIELKTGYVLGECRLLERFISCNSDKEHLFVGVYEKCLYKAGKKIFVKCNCLKSFTYKKGKFYGDSLNCIIQYDKILEWICDTYDCRWLLNIHDECLYRYIVKKTIFKQLISGKIYNTETYVKAVGTTIGLKNFSWRLLREYINARIVNRVSLLDLQDFTVNLNYSIETIIKKRNEYNYLSMINELFGYCFIEGYKINLKWSDKRLSKELDKLKHKNYLRELYRKSSIPIWTDEELSKMEDDNIKVINSEQEFFKIATKEGIYEVVNGYNKSIINKVNIAWYITYPGTCLFICNNLGLMYCNNASTSTYILIDEFIKRVLPSLELNDIDLQCTITI